jgi:hypothetical protein
MEKEISNINSYYVLFNNWWIHIYRKATYRKNGKSISIKSISYNLLYVRECNFDYKGWLEYSVLWEHQLMAKK